MVKKKKSPVKISKAAAKPRASKTKSRRKHTSRASHVAAKTHAASVTYRDRSPYVSSASHHHTHTHGRRSASIIKAIILFLGFVLLLAILANIFAPSIERQHFNKNTSPYMHNNPNRGSGGYTHSSTPSTNRPANNNNYQMNRQYVSPPPSATEAEPSAPEDAPVQQYRRIVPEESYSAPQQ